MRQYQFCISEEKMSTFVKQLFEPVEIRMFPLAAVGCDVTAVRELEGRFHLLLPTAPLTSLCHNAKLIRAVSYLSYTIQKINHTSGFGSKKVEATCSLKQCGFNVLIQLVNGGFKV